MPTYVYEVVLPDGTGGERFEVEQSMHDPGLERHPESGAPVRRVIQPPMIGGRWSESAARSALGDQNLAAKGFTKYVKTGDGQYEKAAGAGPKRISS
ncbi:MAG TPA: FmdB family transcriptional regulator [Phycisphaerae bacterium]|nr:FmdB family transcriptional regulator [Phycisphaerae bacterium]